MIEGIKATQALNSGGIKELESARSQIQAIVPEISTFERAAKGQKPPWTDEEMGQYLQNIGWTESKVKMRIHRSRSILQRYSCRYV